MLVPFECEELEGISQGEGSTCEPNPCIPVAIGLYGSDGNVLWQIDPNTAAYASVGPFNQAMPVEGLAWIPGPEPALFGVGMSLDWSSLISIDPDTGAVDSILGVIDPYAWVTGLTANTTTEELYGVAHNGMLFSINQQTGIGQKIGSLLPFTSALTYDEQRSKFYFVLNSGSRMQLAAQLYAYDPDLQEVEFVGDMQGHLVIGGLADGDGVLYAAATDPTSTLLRITVEPFSVTVVGPLPAPGLTALTAYEESVRFTSGPDH